MKIYDLNDVLISPSVLTRWQRHISRELPKILNKNPNISAMDAGIEKLKVPKIGRSSIFCMLDSKCISMKVKKSEYKIVPAGGIGNFND